MLYMGMEYLRTNHLSLAGHFLKAARGMGGDDPLCRNELGVWAYRKGEYLEGVEWLVTALRLCARISGRDGGGGIGGGDGDDDVGGMGWDENCNINDNNNNHNNNNKNNNNNNNNVYFNNQQNFETNG